ncbi:alpha-N-acetylglucosaminidase TIM-barrel domain-containing protein [Thomasclavelia cocleata]|uniref:alpha-N-acetylglucosaminidase TIM-barrel domain-containing protein n=1 Tax=Thomasclavelia cocleata TaxID=69824 RepID=UPI0024940F70|nr:alpha-N-acetylglucosaminidase TIM-barrel domain-containing protein [Thomasclavelia cocleata]
MKRVLKGILTIAIVISTFANGVNYTMATSDSSIIYPVSEDAYIRSGNNANKNYNYENITQAHGDQYTGKNYKVINTKYYPDGSKIMSVMKLRLPSLEEVTQNELDTYEFEFNIFKNPDYNKSEQTYHFYYTDEVNWSETSLTWNNKPSSIGTGEVLFDFTIPQGMEYESKNDDEKRIRIDVTEKINSLIQQGISTITVYTDGMLKADTSLMIHSKESGDGTRGAKLIASNSNYDRNKLEQLIEECNEIEKGSYNQASYDSLKDSLNYAKDILANGTIDEIKNAYASLLLAKDSLIAEYPVLEDGFIRSDKKTTVYNYENITQAHGSQYVGKDYKVINSKYYPNGNEIIGVMKFALPSLDEVTNSNFDTIKLNFNMFKNPGFEKGNQTYHFYYTDEVNWSETSLTWNNRPESIKHDSSNLLGDFVINQGEEYEIKNDLQKAVSIDISEKIIKLIEEGTKEITVFVCAENKLDTSIMFHSKESGDGTLGAKISASYKNYREQLENLIAQCKELDPSNYTEESLAHLNEVLNEVEEVCISGTALQTHAAYDQLLKAKEALVLMQDPEDVGNIAYQKPTRSNLSKTLSDQVTDGDTSTYWSGLFYPSYVDIDLMDTYALTKLKIYVPEGKNCWYTIYGSNDGSTFNRLYQKHNDSLATTDGDEIIFDTPQSYRIVRVYIEYNQGDDKAYLAEVKAYGTVIKLNTDSLKTGTLEEILDVTSYAQSKYAAVITKEETIENVYGIIDRTIGSEYRDWFSFELVDDDSINDWYEISDKEGKIHIRGNEGLSLTTGLNYYYKNYLNVHISEQTMQVKMPDELVKVNKVVKKETPYQVRYAYNYCTLSYTFAFFGEEQWQRENDWLALNGVNVVLDLAGQEATWIKFLMNFGYSFDDAKDWLSGPAYYAWQFMDNMESFGGPVPDGYVKDRLELARSTQRWKNSLGMQTILQGYAGMVPTNFGEYQPDVKIIKQGNWNGFSRPDMIATDSKEYDEYAKLFYEAQEFVYGATSDYYAVDPFHEGGIRPSGLGDATIATEVLESMLDYDQDAIWVVQGWQSNPTNELLKGMKDNREDHVLIVDLIKYPISDWTKYDRTSYGSTKLDAKEFNGTSWAWGLLANFGGNPSMHGQMEVMVNDIMEARKNSSHMVGLGIISEAQYDNPVMYDLIFDLAWASDDFDLNTWLNSYIERRYGGTSQNAKMAWQIMKEANYDHGVRYTNELFGMKSKAPQDYKVQNIPYGGDKLESALRLLIRDFDKFKDSECYLYDLSEIMRQQVSNYAVLKYNDVLSAKNSDDLEAFKKYKEEFLKAFEILNEVESTQKEQLGGEWIGKAQDIASNYDDFAMDSFTMNAKALITSWGSRSGHRSLKDYGWRNYEGIFKDLYTNIWQDYLNRVEDNMEKGTPLNNIDKNGYFDLYWKWNMANQEYTRDAKDSPEEVYDVLNKVLENCTISGDIDANIGNVAIEGIVKDSNVIKAKAGAINDGDVSTMYIAKAKGEKAPEIILDLIGIFQLSEIDVITNDNNTYDIWISEDGTNWDKVGQGLDKETKFDVQGSIRYIKVVGINNEMALSISEIRAYGERVLPTLDQLKGLVRFGNDINTSGNEQSKISYFENTLKVAVEAINNVAAPDEINTVYWNLYDAIIDLNLSGVFNLAVNKTVTAHNDPSGNSKRLVDNNLSSSWDAGRLSLTGAPYEDKITPAWAIVDLGQEYQIDKIEISFGSNVWHHYTVYGSIDGKEWFEIGAKATNNLPNDGEDIYELENIFAHYIKLEITNVQLESSGKRTPVKVNELIVMGQVKEPLDTEKLQQLVNMAKDINLEEYQDGQTKDTFVEAYTKACKLLSEAVTQDEIDTAVTNLQNAIDNLVVKENVNKAGLKIAIDMAESASLENVVPVVVEEFNAALQNAQTVYANASATQADVDNAFTRLANVMHMLEFFKGDKTALQKMVDQIANLTASEYIESTWNAMTPVLEKAEGVLSNENAMQEEVDEVYSELVKAFVNLRLKPNKDLLSGLIKKANGLNRANYSEASLKVVDVEVEKANVVLNNPEATKEEVEAAVSALTKAMAGLIANPVNTNVSEVKPGDTIAIKTGDDSIIGITSGLMMISLIALIFIGKKAYKE